MLSKFRTLRVMITGALAPVNVDNKAAVVTHFCITPFDTEVFHTASYTFSQLGAIGILDYVFRNAPVRDFVREQRTPFGYSEVIRYKKSVKMWSRIRVETRPVYWDDGMVYFEQRYFHKDNIVAVSYKRGGVFVKRQRLAPQVLFTSLGEFQGAIPEVIANMIAMDSASDGLHSPG